MMLHYKEEQWIIDVSRDCVTDEIDALIVNRVKEEGRYLIANNVEQHNDINIPSHIVKKAKETVEDVLKAIG